MTGPFTQTPGYAKAGFNADQLMAFDLRAAWRRMRLRRRRARHVVSIDGVTASPSLLTGAAQAGLAAAAGAQQAGEQFKAGDAAQLGANEFQPFMNPYTSNVLDTTLNTMRRERNAPPPNIGARAAASGSLAARVRRCSAPNLDKITAIRFRKPPQSHVAGVQQCAGPGVEQCADAPADRAPEHQPGQHAALWSKPRRTQSWLLTRRWRMLARRTRSI